MANDKTTPSEILEKFLKDNNFRIQILPQEIRRLEDGGLLIEPAKVAVGIINTEEKLEKV